MKHTPDFKVIHVRFIKSSSSPTWQLEDDYASSSSRQQCVSEPVTPQRPSRKNPENRAQSTGSPNAKQLSISEEFVHFAYDEAWEAC